MSLESATFISQLVDTNPPGGDDRSTADDHLRVIKAVLKNQFINFNAVQVTATPAQLNGLANLSASLALVTNTLGVATTSTVTAAQLLQFAATLTASRAVSTGAGGVLQSSAASDAELDFLAGVTSAIQPQLDLKIGSKYDRILQSRGLGTDGAVSIIVPTTYSDYIYNATTFNINLAQTLTFDTPFAIIMATTSITINGDINMRGVDVTNRAKLFGTASGPQGTSGGCGGGGGGNDVLETATSGSSSVYTALVATGGGGGAFGSWGAPGVDGSPGTAGVAPSTAEKEIVKGFISAMLGTPDNSGLVGGAGGRGSSGLEGAGGTIGKSAGLLLLIAPIITIGASSTINCDGEAGSSGTAGTGQSGGGGGGGGGAGGVIYFVTPSLTNAGTQSVLGGVGGAGGAGGPGGNNPGDGGDGGDGAVGYVVTLDTDI